MIHVVATIKLRPGTRSRYLEILKENVAKVLQEPGVVEYTPTVDADAGIPGQRLDDNQVVIVEKWESVDALRTHLQTPHMLAYRQKVKELVEEVSIRVLEKA